MEIRKISFYDKFTCLAGGCKQTCCHGWMIPLTPEDRERFREQKGLFKLSLLSRMSSKDIYCFNKGSGTCPFLNGDGLCSLQLKKGHDFIPEACRMFPRFYRNYRAFEERFLDLSCIGAASLFLEEYARMTLTVSEGEPASDPCTTNDDEALLNILLDSREKCIEMLMEAHDLNTLSYTLTRIDEHSAAAQAVSLKGGSIPGISAFTESGGSFINSSGSGRPDTTELLPLNISFFDKIMDSSFYNIRLKFTNPALYRLCRLYFDDPEGMLSSNERFLQAVNGFFAKNKEAANHLAAYYAYYLYLYYLKSYEDYSFVKNTRLGIVHLNMILMFAVLHAGSDAVLSTDDMAMIIASYNRRAYFNEEIVSELYDVIAEHLGT
ncbi:MAG: flagellin lysine-N-methylase [Lachnospiraceae bacterium]|nr:flagellin lysine-N-methylase [Lachnospiraceae bacterium]